MIGIAALIVACGSHKTLPDDQPDDPSVDASIDGAIGSVDGSTNYACNAPPQDLTTCTRDSDCATVAVGCYCGLQPVIGVAVTYAATAATCQAAAADACTLGCTTMPGQSAQDGNPIPQGQTASVRCDLQGAMTGTTGICTTFVP
jgi:hypothetical protein